jgi:SAM-dependent methyltransferase
MNAKTDPAKMNLIAKTAFAPVYPYIAGQIKNKFGITEGVCVDIGSGPGSMAIEMAKISNLKVFSLDVQPEMTAIARKNIAGAGLEKRIGAVTADVCNMPFADDSIDLIISRGSIFFWEDRVGAFREIKRVLKPGAVAYVGGGMGNDKIRDQVKAAFAASEALKDVESPFNAPPGNGRANLDPAELQKELSQAGACGTVTKGDSGMWIEIRKGNADDR